LTTLPTSISLKDRETVTKYNGFSPQQSEPEVTTESLPYLLTPYSTVLLEKLTVSQLVKKFPGFYGT